MSSCSGTDIFGDDTCAGFTPEQEQDLTDVVEKTINILSATQSPDITTLSGELDVQKIKSYEHNVELEFDDTNAILTATNINLSGIVNLDNVITTTQTTFNDNELVTKLYADTTNFQNYSFRNANNKSTLGVPGSVPPYSGSNPVITNQSQLPQGDYYMRYGANVNICLKSLSDLGTATGDDVYQTTLANFWDKTNFPSVTHNYNRSIPINADTFNAFTDNYIRIGWNSPGNDIELTIFQLPAGVSGIYSLAVPHFDTAATVQTLITATGLVTDIFPNGLNVANSLVNVYINPSSNPTDTYPSYNIQFRRVDDVIFMKLDRYFMTTVV